MSGYFEKSMITVLFSQVATTFYKSLLVTTAIQVYKALKKITANVRK